MSMPMSIAIQKSDVMATLFNMLEDGNIQQQNIEVEQLEDFPIHLFLYQDSPPSGLASSVPHFPKSDFFQEGEEIYWNQLKDIFPTALNRWTLYHNLQNLEDLVEKSKTLAHLWQQDRVSFFEELWYAIHLNLATHSLKILFHEMKETQERSRNKLIPTIVEGTLSPNILDGEKKEKIVLDTYYDRSEGIFEFEGQDSQTGQWVAAAKVNKSPFVIMGVSSPVSALQLTFLKGLFKGLNSFLHS